MAVLFELLLLEGEELQELLFEEEEEEEEDVEFVK